MHVSGRELVSFKAALNEAAETYGLTPTSAALDVINLIKYHTKKGQLKRELSELSLQKYAIERFCSSRSQIIMAHESTWSWNIGRQNTLSERPVGKERI